MTGVLAFIGRNTLGLLRYASGLYDLTGKTAYWTFVAPFRGRGLKWGNAIHQMVLTGFNALPIVSLIAFFIGMVLAFQGAYQLEKFGAGYFVAALVGVSMTRELGPLITAIIVAGRSGSAFAAEIGTMKVSEELDALEAMGLNSVKYLVVPKYLALLAMMPCLDAGLRPGGHLRRRGLRDVRAGPDFFPVRPGYARGAGDAGHLHRADQEPGVRLHHHPGGLLRGLCGARRCRRRRQSCHLVGSRFHLSHHPGGPGVHRTFLLHRLDMAEDFTGPLIRIVDVVSHYGERRVLNHVSLEIQAGETMVVLGGSGTGKSTLLRHIIRLEIPTAGHVYLKNHDVCHMPEERFNLLRRKIGMLFQSAALFNSMTIEENVSLPLRELTQLEESTIRIMARIKLDLVGLSGVENYMPAELSGGMRKRAGLARALAMDPEILLFDEPSAGLDPVTAAGIDSLILKLKLAFPLTIVVVTHEMASAFTIADRITVMHEGEIIAVGTPEEIRTSPLPRVQQFLTRTPDEEAKDTQAYLRALTRSGP